MRAAGIAINPSFVEVELLTGEGRYIAERFFDVSVGRSSNGFGVAPLSWLDLDAYCRMRRVKFTNWELDMLRVLDAKFCECANAKKD